MKNRTRIQDIAEPGPPGSEVLAICSAGHPHCFSSSNTSLLAPYSSFLYHSDLVTLYLCFFNSSHITNKLMLSACLTVKLPEGELNSIKLANERLISFGLLPWAELVPQANSGFLHWTQIQSSKHWDAWHMHKETILSCVALKVDMNTTGNQNSSADIPLLYLFVRFHVPCLTIIPWRHNCVPFIIVSSIESSLEPDTQ